MTFLQAVRHFGTQAELARALKLDKSVISKWRDSGIPKGRQFELEVLTEGELRASRK